MRVLGTAGHVDHGKSTLIRRLTGIDPDRLPEEQARAMTIDLGFAWLPLPNGELLGIIDVPGHRDFIGNMLAGVGGIDAVLFVIAADEGVMPQTLEHLAILDLLDLRHGLIALTKTDLVHDADWLELIQTDIREHFARTSLAASPILPVSASNGAGIPTLLDQLVALTPVPRPDLGLPRLAVDRIFTISGFGTVVTGTLLGGALQVGDSIVLQPTGQKGRIRGLQTYQQQVPTALPGSRVAVNLSGIDRGAIKRGDVVTLPDLYPPTQRVDAHLQYLPTASAVLKHDAQVKLYVGAAETVARVRLLAEDVIEPGMTSWVQLELERPITVSAGDRFILRRPSPAQTIGGGVILDAQPQQRWRRYQPTVIAALHVRLSGTLPERLALAAPALSRPETLRRTLGLSEVDFAQALGAAQDQNLVACFGDGSLLSMEPWNSLRARLLTTLARYHATFPLRSGMPREELRSQLKLTSAELSVYLEQLPEVVSLTDQLRLQTHTVVFDYAQTKLIQQLLQRLAGDFAALPSFVEAESLVSADVLYALIDQGQLVRLSDDVLLTESRYAELVAAIGEHIDARGSITVAELRDQLAASRKLAVAVLEHLDAVGVTKRQGDGRVRR